MNDAENLNRFIVVPDISAIELTALAKRDLDPDRTHLEALYASWDYYLANDGTPISGRGKHFEVMIWEPKLAPGVQIETEAVRQHFRELGFSGHAGAFTQWRRTSKVWGMFASMLEDGHCHRDEEGHLSVPCSLFMRDIRSLGRTWISHPWDESWSFVAFRELPS